MKRSITEPEASSFTFRGGELRDPFLRDSEHFSLCTKKRPVRPARLANSTSFSH